MLRPRCESCGGLLEAVPAVAGPSGERLPLRVTAPALNPVFGRILRLTLIALLLFAAARFGWSSGGPGLALAAIGVVGLFTVPLIVGE